MIKVPIRFDLICIHQYIWLISLNSIVLGGVVKRMRYVTEQGCRPKSLRGVTEGGGWVKMAIFSVTYLLNHPKPRNETYFSVNPWNESIPETFRESVKSRANLRREKKFRESVNSSKIFRESVIRTPPYPPPYREMQNFLRSTCFSFYEHW